MNRSRFRRHLLLVLACSTFAACGDGVTTPKGCDQFIDGLCWTHLGLHGEVVVEIAVTEWGIFAGTADSGIYRLEPGGGWSQLGPATWHGHLIPNALHFVASDGPRLLTGLSWRVSSSDTTRAAIYASFDRGDTWVPHDGGMSENSPFTYRAFAHALAGHPSQPERVFMSNSHGVLRSLDGGESWGFVYGSYDRFMSFYGLSMHPDDPDHLWVAGLSNFFVPFVGSSSSAGADWNWSIPRCNGSQVGWVYALALDPGDRRRLWAAASGGVLWADADLEGEWSCISFGLSVVALAELQGELFALSVEESRMGPLHRRRAGSDSWQSLEVPKEAEAPVSRAVAIDPERRRILIGTRSGIWGVWEWPELVP